MTHADEQQWHREVEEWIDHGLPTTIIALARKVGVSKETLRRYLNGKVVRSLNKHRGWILSKIQLRRVKKKQKKPLPQILNRDDMRRGRKRRGDELQPTRMGFVHWRGAVFHALDNIEDVLVLMAKTLPDGLTQEEAKRNLGRPTSRAFMQLVAGKRVAFARFGGQKVYCDPKRIEEQMKGRRLRHQPEEPEKERKEVGEIAIGIEEILKTVAGLPSGVIALLEAKGDSLPIFLALMYQYLRKGTYRRTEATLRLDPRIRDGCGFTSLEDVPDFTTLCRHFTRMPAMYLKHFFMDCVKTLRVVEVINGRLLAVDGTHAFAWANTSGLGKEVRKPVEGAAWGYHHKYFYGYTVTIIVDTEAELPIAVKIGSADFSEVKMVIPLLDEITTTYPDMKTDGLLGDALFDVPELRKATMKKLKADLLTPLNPRRSKGVKCLKQEIKALFDEYGEQLTSVEQVFRLLGQSMLEKYGLECHGPSSNRFLNAIKERLLRAQRIVVERVFSRAKGFTKLERPQVRKHDSLIKHILLCFTSLLVVALTAHRLDIPQAKLAYSRFY